jgi:hypothetical protein
MSIFSKNTNSERPLETTTERAWELMGDFDTYPDWNPLAPKMKGKAQAGKRALGLLVVGPSWLKVPFWPKILTADENRELRWRGGLPLLFTADHRMILDSEDQEAPKIRHSERFNGLLVLLLRPTLGLITKGVYKRYDIALNKAAKALPAAGETGDGIDGEAAGDKG